MVSRVEMLQSRRVNLSAAPPPSPVLLSLSLSPRYAPRYKYRGGARSPLSGAGGSKSGREGLQLRTRERVHSHPFLIPPGNRPPQLSGLHALCEIVSQFQFIYVKDTLKMVM